MFKITKAYITVLNEPSNQCHKSLWQCQWYGNILEVCTSTNTFSLYVPISVFVVLRTVVWNETLGMGTRAMKLLQSRIQFQNKAKPVHSHNFASQVPMTMSTVVVDIVTLVYSNYCRRRRETFADKIIIIIYDNYVSIKLLTRTDLIRSFQLLSLSLDLIVVSSLVVSYVRKRTL